MKVTKKIKKLKTLNLNNVLNKNKLRNKKEENWSLKSFVSHGPYEVLDF